VPLNFSLINRNASFVAHIIYNVERHNSRSVQTEKKTYTPGEEEEREMEKKLELTTTGCDSHSYYSFFSFLYFEKE
jgi:hypothetical protein